jgi:hypothetical protein
MPNTTWLPNGGIPKPGGEYLFNCPQCYQSGDKPKFSYNVVVHKGHCFACGAGCGTEQGLRMLFSRVEGREVDTPTGGTLRKMYDRGVFLPVGQVAEAHDYLLKRHVAPQDALEAGALWQLPRIHFPIWSPFSGNPLMTIGRDTRPDAKVRWSAFPGNKSKYLFGKIPKGGEVVVTEGIFHVLSSGLWGQALALLGKVATVDMVVWLLKNFTKITLWLDVHEESGRHAQGELLEQLNIFRTLTPWKVDILQVPCYHQELGACTPEEAADVLVSRATRVA